jgi:ABC-type bacteriocin/lantibiotic exporter with double-glycine peptidase domain
VQGLEDIKLMQAENRFLQQWNSYIQITAESGLRTRELTQGCYWQIYGSRQEHEHDPTRR